ncbi:MAG: NAD(P)H-quinone oxidoreductase [Pyrinomonadaceae bacterium]
MKAVYITEFDGTSIELRDVPDLAKPTVEQVLVRVQVAGLNRADLLQARGLYPPPAGYSPNVPGLEFAGEIAAVGDDVKNLQAGERVFGITAGEAQAEYLLIDASLCAKIPDNLSFAQAAAIPEAFITAHDAIITQGDLKSGETLLIHAVGSGVGLAALQIAKSKDVTVVGTSRTADKLARCDEFGLDVGILTDKEIQFAEQIADITDGKGADVILDLVGAAHFEQNVASLAQKGRLMLVGLTSGRTAEFNLGIALQKRAHIIGTVFRSRSTEEKATATRRFADEIVPLIAAGIIRPNLDRVFAAATVVDAHKYLESNESFGKVVLEF